MDKNIVLTLLFLILIASLFLKKNRHTNKLKNAVKIINTVDAINNPSQKLAYLRKVDPYAFEEMILTLLQRKGFVIARNKRYSGDGGFDGRFEYHRQQWLIQAKRYSHRVKLEHVTAFSALLKEKNCPGGIFVHTGKTPASVRDYVNSCITPRIEMVSGKRLLNLFDSSLKLTF